MTNCPNCCAPVDLQAEKCAYCGTPYPEARRPMIKIDANGITIFGLMERGIMTANEARRAVGLNEV